MRAPLPPWERGDVIRTTRLTSGLALVLLYPGPLWASVFPKIPAAADRVTVGPVPTAAKDLSRRFEIFDRMTRDANDALDHIAAHYDGMNMATAAEIHDQIVDRAVADYEQLATDPSLRQGVESIWSKIANGPQARADAPLSAHAIDLMVAPDHPSLYNILFYLKRRGALDALRKIRAEVPGNALIENSGPGKPTLAVLDLSAEAPGGRGGKSRALRILVAALHGMPATRRWSFILKDSEILGEVSGGDRRIEIFEKLGSDPRHDEGIIRIKYMETGYGFGSEARLRFVAGLLYRANFSVDVREGVLAALLDPTEQNLDAGDLERAAAFVIRAFVFTDGLDRALALLARDGPSDAEFEQYLDQWATVLMAEGDLPFYVNGNPEATIQRYRQMLAEGSIQRIVSEFAKKAARTWPATPRLTRAATIEVDQTIGSTHFYMGKVVAVTFNRVKADSNHLLISPNAIDADYLKSLDKAAGFIAASGRLSDPLANKAARSGIFAAFIRSELSPSGLFVKLRLGSKRIKGVLREGDHVRIVRTGVLELLPK